MLAELLVVASPLVTPQCASDRAGSVARFGSSFETRLEAVTPSRRDHVITRDGRRSASGPSGAESAP